MSEMENKVEEVTEVASQPVETLEKVELKMDVGEALSKYDALWQELRFSAE